MSTPTPTKEDHEAKLRAELIEKILGWKFGRAGLIAEERIRTLKKVLQEQPTEVLLNMHTSSEKEAAKKFYPGVPF